MTEPAHDPGTAAREADAAELYAPPLGGAPLPPEPLPPGAERSGPSPALMGFLTLLVTVPVSASVAGGLMALWHEITPIGKGFLAGLGEALFAVFATMALSVFALLASIPLAVGVLGQSGTVSRGGWLTISVLGVAALVVCFLPTPPSTFAIRGFLGVFSELITVGLTFAALRFTRRSLLGLRP